MSPADWIATIARAYLAAPDHSPEEELLVEALHQACDRIGADPHELLDRMINVAPVTKVSFEDPDAG